MTAKEFVKSRYPNAWAEKINRRGPFKEFYYLVWSDYRSRGPQRIGEGDENKPQSNAWVNAKKQILETEAEQQAQRDYELVGLVNRKIK